MKKKEYYNSKIKHQLSSKLKSNNNREKSLFWKLTDEQVEFITKLGYEVKPYLYRIETKLFKKAKKLKENILKEIHYKKKSGRKEYFRVLSSYDKKILDNYGIKYDVIRYQISFNQK